MLAVNLEVACGDFRALDDLSLEVTEIAIVAFAEASYLGAEAR